jgi:hypothetical protein
MGRRRWESFPICWWLPTLNFVLLEVIFVQRVLKMQSGYLGVHPFHELLMFVSRSRKAQQYASGHPDLRN